MVQIFKTLISKFYKAFLAAFLAYLTQEIGTTTEQIIALANDIEGMGSLSGPTKAKKLAERLRALAISKGKEVSDRTINLAIETAVSVLKG